MSFPINEKLAEGTVLLSAVVYASPGTTTETGPAIDMSQVRKVITYFAAGTLAGGEVVSCSLQGCSTSGGSYTAISGTSVTLTAANTDSNKTQVVEISAEGLNDLGLGYRYIQAVFTCGTGSPMAVVSVGAGGPEEPIGSGPAASTHIKAVTQI